MGTRQSQLIGLGILALSLCLVLAYVGQLGWTTFGPKPPPPPTPVPSATPTPQGPYVINYYVAPSAEDYFRQAAAAYNKEFPRSADGRAQEVKVYPVDSISTWRKYEAGKMNPLPHAWVPESRVFPLLVNDTVGQATGKDVFFEGGQYRIQPTLLSVPVFLFFESRANVLTKQYGPSIGWRAIYSATKANGWQNLGGPADFGVFRWIQGNPLKDPVAVYGIQNAAGAYFGRPAISPDDLADPGFAAFMKAILASSANLGLGSYGLDDLRLFRHSFGDGGVFMEKDVLDHLADASKWEDPLRVTYPEYVAWLDYPVAIWMGDEFSAEEKNIALDFSRYVRTAPMQQLAVQMGFRPVNEEVLPSKVVDSPFVRWQSVGVIADITRMQGMRFMSRDVLDAILQFYRVDVLGQKK
jgi:hypothetical protein